MKGLFAYILFFNIFFYSCSKPDDNNNQTGQNSTSGKFSVPSELQGKWYRLDKSENFYLSNSTDLILEKIEQKLIKVKITDASIPYYAIRYGIDNATLKGKVNTLNSSLSSSIRTRASDLSSVANINVILQNINNEEETKTVTTDSNGNFQATDLKSSEYSVKVTEENIKAETNINVIGDSDLGVFTPVEENKWNFKASVATFERIYDWIDQVYEYSASEEFIYGDFKTYNAQIRIKNIGSTDALAVNYEISCTDPLIINLKHTDPQKTTLGGILGTIEPNKEKIIDVEFQTKFFSNLGYNDIYKDVKINVKTKDVDNNSWNDYVIIRIYRRKAAINLNSLDNYLNGFIIFPNNHLLQIAYKNLPFGNPPTKDIQFLIPFRPDMPYKIMLSNTSVDTETTYSLGINTDYNSDLINFSDTSIYEPNNTDSTAKTLLINDKITAFLHKTDLDYYIIDMSNPVTEDPVLLKYYSHTVYDGGYRNTTGNNDGKVNPGETIRLNIAIKNIGTSTAFQVKAALSTDDIYATIDPNWINSDPDPDPHCHSTVGCYDTSLDIIDNDGTKEGPIGDINLSEIKDCDGKLSTEEHFGKGFVGDYLITIGNSAPIGHTIVFTLAMTDKYSNVWTDTFSLITE